MKKILLMSFSILISSIPSTRFSYATERGEFIYELQQLSNIQYELSTINDPISMNLIDDESVLDYIDARTPMLLTMNEAFILGYTEADNSTTNKNPDDSTAENILTSTSPVFSTSENQYFQQHFFNENHFRTGSRKQNDHLNQEKDIIMAPPPDVFIGPLPVSKPKSSKRIRRVELTTSEIKEISRIHTAGPEGLDFENLNKRDIKTWTKIFNDGLSLKKCLKRREKQKNKKLYNKKRKANPEVKKRRKEYDKKRSADPEVKKRRAEYNKKRSADPEVKKRRAEYNKKRRAKIKERKRGTIQLHSDIFSNNEVHDPQHNTIVARPPPAVFIAPPPVSKPKPSKRKRRVELTTAEIKEITCIYKAGLKNLKNPNKRYKKTWTKIFNDGITLKECLERRRVCKHAKEYYADPKINKRIKGYNTKTEVKESRKKYQNEYRKKRKRDEIQHHSATVMLKNNRPLKKRKLNNPI